MNFAGAFESPRPGGAASSAKWYTDLDIRAFADHDGVLGTDGDFASITLTTNQEVIWTRRCPSVYSGGDIDVVMVYTIESGTPITVELEVSVGRVEPGDGENTSFAAPVSSGGVLIPDPDKITITTVRLTKAQADDLVVGLFQIQVQRVDTAGFGLDLLHVSIQEV